MENKPEREKIDGKYHYFCTVNGVKGLHSLLKMSKSKECVVTKQVLSARLTTLFAEQYTKLTTVQQCMESKPNSPRRNSIPTLGDFDELNDLWHKAGT